MRPTIVLLLLAVLWATSAHPLLRFSLNKKRLNSVICENGLVECPDGNTCCKRTSGGYGCCNLPNAVCCSDGVHCCPQGRKCDLSSRTCTLGTTPALSTAFVKLDSAPTRDVSSQNEGIRNVICPDGQSVCPDGDTCCVAADSSWKCCPQPNAVCCSDKEHCCPAGYTCNPPYCTRPGSKIVAFTRSKSDTVKMVGGRPSLTNVICPDQQSECPDGETCCVLTSEQYGCCPESNAVCCLDHIHCCPAGDKCDLASGTCVRPSRTIPMLRKKPPFPFNKSL